MAPRAVLNKTLLFLKKNPHYFLVFFVLIFAIFYHYFMIPSGALKSDKASKDKVQIEQPDLDVKHREKVYPHAFQSQAGDVFRVGIFASTKNIENVEVFAESELNETLKIGEWNLQPSENGEYKELIFSVLGRYENIIIRLKKDENEDAMNNKVWDDSAVSIHSFFISRVEVKGTMSLRNLTPTIFGISSMKKDILLSLKDVNKDANGQNDLSEWVFQSNGDFLQALEFSGNTVGSGRQEYVFSLMRYFPDKKDKEGALLHTAPFILDALDDLLVPTGNYQIPFLFPLKRGEWYKVTLTKTPSKDWDNFFTLGLLRTDLTTKIDSPAGDLALLVRERIHAKNGASFPDGARLEDLGDHLSYNFSLQGTLLDFTNIVEASGGIAYDAKKRLVVGKQKNGEYFVYKFDMPDPFNRFALKAMQADNDAKEIKLEYSFDNEFWREASFTKELGAPVMFSLNVSGDGRSRSVYVRVSYSGENKKSGFFAIEALSVNASILKSQ